MKKALFIIFVEPFRILIYQISHFMLFLFLFCYNRLTWRNKKNVPFKYKNGIILAANHSSNLDPPIVGTPFFRRIYFLAKKSLFKGVLGLWTKIVGGVSIDRNETSPGSLKKILKLLKSGKTIVIFPEGTRSEDGELKKFRGGVGMIAKSSKAMIIPTFVKGNYKAFRKGKKFPSPKKITVYYGQPLEYSDLIKNEQKLDNKEVYQQISDRIYEKVKELKEKHD